MHHETFPKFHGFFESLVRSATSKGIVLGDAQDLAGDAVERALEGFDPAKGGFAPYCHTILGNLMKNYWRDRKPSEEFDEGNHTPAEDDIDPIELAETVASVHAALAELQTQLSSEEKRFLLHLKDVLEDSGSRAISEAARRSGLTPAKGWDLFRKIQRKATHLPSLGELPEAPAPSQAQVRSISPMGADLAVFSADPVDPISRFTVKELLQLESFLA